MLQTMLVTEVTALQNKDEINHWENRPFVGSWPVPTKERKKEDHTRNRIIRKKHKRVRTAFTTDQLRALEKTFLRNKYITSDNRRELSKQLIISEKCTKIWFQNRRMKEKRESSESGDASNESYGQDVMSPPLARKSEPVTENHSQYDNQCNLSPYFANYHTPTFQAVYVMEPQNLYEPQDIDFTLGNGGFFNDTNPYPTHYYPCSETAGYQTNVYQNTYQQNNEMYYWWHDNMDLFNYFQY